VLHFLRYWARFLLLVWFELPLYAVRAGRTTSFFCMVAAMISYFVSLACLWRHSPTFAFWVFVFPTFANSFMLMWGNWCQHVFVNPSCPRSNYGLAYNVINHPCNQRSFNDGYHLEHHLHSRRHWSELPRAFLANLPNYAPHGALIFNNIDFFGIGLLVMLGRYDLLGKHLVPPRSAQEAEALLRHRLLPVK